jgi:hypothetical protein
MADRVVAEKVEQLKKSRQRRLKRRAKADIAGNLNSMLPPYGEAPTEFEVQAFLYAELNNLGWYVRGKQKSRCGTAKFDLLVYDEGGSVTRIIEVKKQRLNAQTASPLKNRAKSIKHQVKRYAAFQVPVDLVCGLKEAKVYVAKAAKSIIPVCSNEHSDDT